LEMHDDVPHPKARYSRKQRNDAAVAASLKKTERAEQKAHEADAAKAAEQDHYADAVDTCSRCGKKFMGSGWFARHSLSLCIDRAAALEAKRRSRRVELVLKASDELYIEQNLKRLRSFRCVRVSLHGNAEARFGGRSVGLRVNKDFDKEVWTVSSVDERSLSFFSGRIDCGFVLVSINGADACTATIHVLKEQLLPGEALELVFLRPQAPLPLHGIARKGIHKSVRYILHHEQLQWLNQFAFSGGRALLRDKEAAIAMKSYFHDKMRDDIHAPMWLDQAKIATWLAARVKDEKERRRALKRTASWTGRSAGEKRKISIDKSESESDDDSDNSGDDELG
jgi:hypothetical protein